MADATKVVFVAPTPPPSRPYSLPGTPVADVLGIPDARRSTHTQWHSDASPCSPDAMLGASQVRQLPSALGGMRGLAHLVNAAMHGCCTATEREAVWSAVQNTADDVSRLSEPNSREVGVWCVICRSFDTALREAFKRDLLRQAHDTRAAALQDALTQSMLECMTLHAEAGTRASEASCATWT